MWVWQKAVGLLYLSATVERAAELGQFIIMTEYKLVLVGPSGVGKDALATQFVEKYFNPDIVLYYTVTETSYRKQVLIDGEMCILDIVEALNSPYGYVRDLYLKKGEGFLCVFAVDSMESFEDIHSHREDILKVKELDDVPMVLVGNKIDLPDHEVDQELALAYAKHYHMPYVETSAKNSQGVEDAFHTLVREIRKINTKAATKGSRVCEIF